jgi:hypothetical protein
MPAFLPVRPGMPMADCADRKQNHNPGLAILTRHLCGVDTGSREENASK